VRLLPLLRLLMVLLRLLMVLIVLLMGDLALAARVLLFDWRRAFDLVLLLQDATVWQPRAPPGAR